MAHSIFSSFLQQQLQLQLLLLVLVSLLLCSSSSSSSPPAPASIKSRTTDQANTTNTAIGFAAELIHRASPLSPFYDPNATADDRVQASLHRSRARVEHLARLMTTTTPATTNDSRVVSPIEYIDSSYVMKFSIGTPPVPTYGLLDTGSRLVWLECQPCDRCQSQTAPRFHPGNSSSYHPFLCAECLPFMPREIVQCGLSQAPKCTYFYRYVDGAYTQGEIAKENFAFQGNSTSTAVTVLNLTFGCGFNDEGTPEAANNPPGVVGLSYKYPSLVASLLGSGPNKKFSYCVRSDPNEPSSIKFGASVPENDPWANHATIKLCPNDKGWYMFTKIEGMYVENVKLDIPSWVFNCTTQDEDESTAAAEGAGGGVVIDTGTTYSFLHSLAMGALIPELKTQIRMEPHPDDDWPLCYSSDTYYNNYTYEMPRIQFRFVDGDRDPRVTLMKDNVWMDTPNNLTCLAMLASSGDLNLTVLGMYQQRGVKVTYDLEAMTISWVNPESLYDPCEPF